MNLPLQWVNSLLKIYKQKASFVYVSSIALQKTPLSKTDIFAYYVFFLQNIAQIEKIQSDITT